MANHNPEYNLLPAGDSRWRGITAPLLRHVRAQGSVTIDDVLVWGKGARCSNNRVKNMLAWLSFNGLVAYDEHAHAWKVARVEQTEEERDEAV